MTIAAALLALPVQGTGIQKARPPETKVQSPKDATDPVQEGRRALAARVTKAHRGDGKDPIDRYRTTITISTLGKKAENLDVRLVVSYGANIPRGKGATPAEMIRYTFDEGDKLLERGKDPRPWQRVGSRVTGLLSKDDTESRDLLDSHTRLCKQLLQFLDAGAILRGLRGDDPVKTTTLKLGRSRKIEAEFITGKLASFPVFRAPDKAVRRQSVFMEAWIDKKTSRLAAVQIFHLAPNGKPRRDSGEFITLGKYATSKGTLIPRELFIYAASGSKREPRARVSLSAFELNADLTKTDFARPN
jgi:hypothetical protein